MKNLPSLLSGVLATGCFLAGPLSALEVMTFAFDPNQPGSAFGWTTRAAYQNDPENNILIMPSDLGALDWAVPRDSAPPGVGDRKAGGDRLQIQDPAGFNQSGAHSQWDPHVVYWYYTDGEEFGESSIVGYTATSWIGSGTNEAVWTFRVRLDADPVQVIQFHNFANIGSLHQMTVTHFSGSDATRDSHVFLYNDPGTIDWTSIINVQGQAQGDYITIEHAGSNIGWRGILVLEGEATEPPPPACPEHTWVVNDRFGGIYHLSGCWVWWTGDLATNWGFVYGADISEDDTGWAFHATHGWLYMFGGTVSDVLWIHSAQNGWLAASASYGPRFYDVSSQSWMDWN